VVCGGLWRSTAARRGSARPGAGAAHGLAVDGDDPSPTGYSDAGAHPRPQDRVEPVGVQAGEGSADRGLARATPGRDAERDQHARLGVSDPLTDRGERAGPGQDRDQRDRQQTREPVTDPAASPRIGDLLEELEQTRTRQPERLDGRGDDSRR